MWNYGVFGIQRDERLWERTCVHMRRSELTSSTNAVRLAVVMVCMLRGTESVYMSSQRSINYYGSVML